MTTQPYKAEATPGHLPLVQVHLITLEPAPGTGPGAYSALKGYSIWGFIRLEGGP